jgi:hypothetical protein
MLNFDYGQLKKAAKNRDIYIWGAGSVGYAFYKKLEHHGIKAKGFLDSKALLHNTAATGIPVLPPPPPDGHTMKPYIVIMPQLSKDIEKWCIELGLKQYEDFIHYEYIAVYIDPVSMCNLRCPSCARGNSKANSSTGMMKKDIFMKIADKIIEEYPDIPLIHLYNWGESFLHADMPEFISYLKNRGVYSMLSSNLSLKNNIDEILKTDPLWLKVSLSGYIQDVYNVTHTDGDINLVKSNLYRIRYLLDKYKLNTIIEIFYHKYLNNLGCNYEKMMGLTHELGFLFNDCTAGFYPLERILDKTYPKELLPLLVDRSVFTSKKGIPSNKSCLYQTNQLLIDCTGRLPLCCATFDDSTLIDIYYLDIPLNDTITLKLNHPFCTKCKAHGMAILG